MFKRKKPTLVDARQAFQDVKDYWESRMRLGDPLFDQWMFDSFQATVQGLDALNKLEEAGHDTGKSVVKTSLKPFKRIHIYIRDEPQVRHSKTQFDYSVSIDGKKRLSTSATVVDDSESAEEIVEKDVRKFFEKSIGDETSVKIKLLSVRDYYFRTL